MHKSGKGSYPATKGHPGKPPKAPKLPPGARLGADGKTVIKPWRGMTPEHEKAATRQRMIDVRADIKAARDAQKAARKASKATTKPQAPVRVERGTTGLAAGYKEAQGRGVGIVPGAKADSTKKKRP